MTLTLRHKTWWHSLSTIQRVLLKLFADSFDMHGDKYKVQTQSKQRLAKLSRFKNKQNMNNMYVKKIIVRKRNWKFLLSISIGNRSLATAAQWGEIIFERGHLHEPKNVLNCLSNRFIHFEKPIIYEPLCWFVVLNEKTNKLGDFVKLIWLHELYLEIIPTQCLLMIYEEVWGNFLAKCVSFRWHP
jgi:hypothetical protein